jgi:hypothetical protein
VAARLAFIWHFILRAAKTNTILELLFTKVSDINPTFRGMIRVSCVNLDDIRC